MSVKLTLSDFIQRAILQHGFLYDYSNVEYINNKTKVIIICRRHGDFLQTPNNHLQGVKCPTCSNGLKTIKTFINDARFIHGNVYDYSKTIYNGSHDKIIITCHKHGDFSQKPNGHLTGRGCPCCAQRGYDNSKDGYLYLLISEKANIVKIGITNNPKERHIKLKYDTPFNFKIVYCFRMVGVAAQSIEKHFKQSFKSANLSGFDGATEWLIKSDTLINRFKSFCGV